MSIKKIRASAMRMNPMGLKAHRPVMRVFLAIGLAVGTGAPGMAARIFPGRSN
jgi:hypothetical protein